jgi:hypothetical protein
MTNPLERLKNKVLGSKDEIETTGLTNILILAREFSCIDLIIGRNFDVMDKNGKEILFRIRQRPMALKQLNNLLKELKILKSIDAEIERRKWGVKGKGKIPKRLGRK